ncbi:MAG: CHASE2 domain-containing protein [Parasphingorhabdus sp.]
MGVEWMGVALAASLLIVGLIQWDGLSEFDNLIYDQLSDLNRPAASEEILIVAIDEDSLSAFGKWPWSRDRHVELFEKMATARSEVIAFDILLSEASDPKTDSRLAQSISANPNLYLPVHFVFPGANGAEFDLKEPVSPIKESAQGLGHVNLVFDKDGMVRRSSLCFEDTAGKIWPHLMEQAYRQANDHASSAFARQSDCTQKLLLPYAARGSYTTISYAALVNGEMPTSFLRDKVVLVGATAQGLGDQHPVPMRDGGTLAGVEIMANLYSALLDDSFITPLPKWQQLVLSLLPVWILLAGFWRWRPRTTIFVSISLIFLVLIASLALLSIKVWFAPGAALAGLVFVYPIWGWRRLQSTSDFMDEELENFRLAKVDIPVVATSAGPVDVITGQAEELTHAIAHVRDLRRFITDALTNLPDPMFITGLDGKVKFVNKLAQTGIEDGSQDLALDDMLNRFVAPADLDEVKEYLAMQTELKELDYVDFTSLNDEVFAMRRASVVSDEGELRGYIHYLADITEVANAAQEREEVLQLLSHDMRAPQAAILALLDGQTQSEVTKRIESHARRTLTLADNFVGLARIKSNEFSGEEILLSDLVIEANDSLWPLAKARNIKSTVEDESEGAFILGEPSSLHRSFVNLIDNAIKYSPDNSTIAIMMRIMELDKDPYVSISIKDEGDGISEDMLDNLFERFASDDTGSKGSVKGAGLGLNFVAKVIERHGGSIRAENIQDKKGSKGGAQFTVLLPTAPDPEIV